MRDRYERRHRRTAAHPECIALMSQANFDAAPSLAEAMGLEGEPMTTHTHTGYRSHVGHVHCGAKLWGHRIPKAGRTHALTGGPMRFVTLCGETVDLCRYDFGEPLRPNVRPVGDSEVAPVTCKRCLCVMKSKA